MVPRPPIVLSLVAAVAAVSGCADESSAEGAAAARFGEFQSALFARDRASLADLVCRDAREAIPDLCRTAADRKPLVVTGVTRSRHEYRVHVRDPDRGDEEAFYVLTREDGVLRVDLLTTAAYHRYASGPAPSPRFEPGRLDPHEVERARAALARERR